MTKNGLSLILSFLFTLSSCVSVQRPFVYNENWLCNGERHKTNGKLIFKDTDTHVWTDYEKQELTKFVDQNTCLNYGNEGLSDVILTISLENKDPSPSFLETSSFIAGALTLFLIVPSYRKKAESIHLEINEVKNNRKGEYSSTVNYTSIVHILALPVLLFKETKYAIDVEKKVVREVLDKARTDKFKL